METTSNSITITIPGLQEGDRIEQYHGRKMLNHTHPSESILPGSTLIVRPVSGRFIEWGETYCLYFNDDMVVGRLMPGDDEDHIKVSFINEEDGFLPVQFSRSEIKCLGRVRGVLTMRAM